ncbi:hypothetical protein D9M71_760810 [compost metagenome]
MACSTSASDNPPSGPIRNARVAGLAWLTNGSATGCSTNFNSASVCFNQSASSNGGWITGTVERPHCSQALIAT